MARARIQINGVTQTTATVAIGGLVLLSNDDEGGELTYGWAFLDQPEGTADLFDNSAIENPSFTPTKEGTYLIRLVVNSGTGTQAIATATVAVLDARTRERLPAAGEIVETDSARGWATAVNRSMVRALRSSVDANLVIAQTPGSIAPGQIVTLTGMAAFNSGTQAAFTVVQLETALGTVEHRERLGVMIDGVTPGVFGAGALVMVRMFGLVPFSASGSPAVSDPVFLGDSGAPELTAGTVQRVIGYVVAISGGSYQWVIDSGVGLADASVTTAKIADASVTTAKIADASVTTAKIAELSSLVFADNSSPVAPDSGDVTLFGTSSGGRQMIAAVGPTGDQMALQPFMATKNIAMWLPRGGSTIVDIIGGNVPTATGTITTRPQNSTSYATGINRVGFVSSSAAASSCGFRNTIAQYWRGNVANAGGFHVVFRWMISDAVIVTTGRSFVGMQASTGSPGDIDPSSLTNLIGVGTDANDTVLQLYAAGAVAQARTSLGVNFPANTTLSDVYELALFCPPNGSTITYQLTRLNTGDVAAGTISNAANLPSSTTFLTQQMWRTNGATAAAVAFDLIGFYGETAL